MRPWTRPGAPAVWGAEVHVVLLSEAEMPARLEEVHHAKEEGHRTTCGHPAEILGEAEVLLGI